jgi:hypothetical protein
MSYDINVAINTFDRMKRNHKKIRKVYIHTWLFKYLKARAPFTAAGELIVRGTILIPTDAHKHNEAPHNYFFSDITKKAELRVLARQADISKLYQLMRYYRKRFYQELIDYAAARHNILPAQTALRDFLRNLDIYESDYSTEAAYKKWQRSQEYAQLQGSSIFSGQGKLSLEKYNKIRPLLKLQHEITEKIKDELNIKRLYG